MQPADTLRTFIENIGRRAEAEFWLTLFRAEAKERFATLVVEGPVLTHAFDAVVVELRFLASVQLVPVVAVGLYDAVDTPGRARRLQQALTSSGIAARVLPFADTDRAHEPIAEAARDNCIPVVPFGEAAGATVGERFACLSRLVCAIRSKKVIFLSNAGALRRDNVPIAVVNLTTEYEALRASPDLSDKQVTLLDEARRLVLSEARHTVHVAVTSPFDLLRELFTVKGAGTLLRRGAVISVRRDFGDVDVSRLRHLLSASFGRPPKEAFFQSKPTGIYLEEDYRGAAIMYQTELGSYLSKFAVDRAAQGEGLGRDLWERFCVDHPVVYWRARAGNPINTWYMKECDGFVRNPDWIVFWRGLETDRIAEVVRATLSKPDDMGAPPGPSDPVAR